MSKADAAYLLVAAIGWVLVGLVYVQLRSNCLGKSKIFHVRLRRRSPAYLAQLHVPNLFGRDGSPKPADSAPTPPRSGECCAQQAQALASHVPTRVGREALPYQVVMLTTPCPLAHCATPAEARRALHEAVGKLRKAGWQVQYLHDMSCLLAFPHPNGTSITVVEVIHVAQHASQLKIGHVLQTAN